MAANNIRKKSDMYLIYYLSTAFAVILFATVFVYFANMLFLKIRKKEFAIYFLLGVRKKEIGQILDNAVKYSRDDGEISIYGINEHYDQRLVIRDHGVGIRAEDVRRVFDKGYTGVNGRKKTTSTGVGLYLSNKLAKKLGHEIRIDSVFGEGTTVEIVIQE